MCFRSYFGVIAAFAILYPNAEMFIMFIPFQLKAKVLFPIAIVVSLFLGISGSGGILPILLHWWRFGWLYFELNFGKKQIQN